MRLSNVMSATAVTLTLIGTSATISGCGGTQAAPDATYTEAAEAAWARAERAFARRDWEVARELYADVYSEFPYSEYAPLAELRIADCFFEERVFARAAEAYRRFVRFHPTHERVVEAQYRIAQSYVKQMPRDWFMMPPSYERDLTQVRNAYDSLRSFLATYGDSGFAEDARADLARARDRLAGYELYVAEFYMRDREPEAAARRTEFLWTTYPDATQVPNALFLHARAMLLLGDADRAATSLHQLTTQFPESELGVQAAEYLVRYGLSDEGSGSH
jgi:outer membrane protein assembly factor BamD